MKLFHLSDLHLGKLLNGYSLINDQKYILARIVELADEKKPDVLLISGDVYDKSVSSSEAVTVFDDFLTGLSKRNITVIVISGNHDSAERLAFGSGIMNRVGIHMNRVYDGSFIPVTLTDEYGEVNFYSLSFIKPSVVRHYLPDEEKADIESYTDAVRKAIELMHVDTSKRNVLLSHQFVAGAAKAGSEEISVGGSDNVDVSVYDTFDYVALGHIHSAQKCGRETIRYSGTPLKYSLAESRDTKVLTIADIGEKGNVSIDTEELIPLRDLCEIRGTYDELTALSFYKDTALCEDYVYITLTDEDDVPNAAGKLGAIYKRLLGLRYDNKRTRENKEIAAHEENLRKSELDLLSDLYFLQNNVSMNEKQEALARMIFENLKEENA